MKEHTIKQQGWKFDNTYITLPEIFFSEVEPEHVPAPKLVIYNSKLGECLGLNEAVCLSNEGIDVLVGNTVPENTVPLAQAYAGHQFGHFTKLGDGRAVLVGEHLLPNNQRVDIQLKGAGRTPYSRRGDGKATLGPMLREYIISEAMHGLGIPTTRSLAVLTTGELIQRETLQQGAVLVRTASSHLRVGTFEYAARWGTKDELKCLVDYAIERHYPSIQSTEEPYLELLKEVTNKQAQLIAQWNLVGFIHGVMNTDNVTISGETIDYGPCAFMDTYDIQTVFSSIDHQGRYAYGNQAPITGWNMARFAETLLPLIHENKEEAIKRAQEVVSEFSKTYHQYWLVGMGAKLGLVDVGAEHKVFIYQLLELMQEHKADYTNTFKALTVDRLEGEALFEQEEFKSWYIQWQEMLENHNQSKEQIKERMRQHNPAVIPRNHKVEEALYDMVMYGKKDTMERLLEVLKDPYAYSTEQENYSQLPQQTDTNYRTYCGT